MSNSRDLDTLRAHAGEKHFHYAIIPSRRTRRYSYAALAFRHYRTLTR